MHPERVLLHFLPTLFLLWFSLPSCCPIWFKLCTHLLPKLVYKYVAEHRISKFENFWFIRDFVSNLFFLPSNSSIVPLHFLPLLPPITCTGINDNHHQYYTTTLKILIGNRPTLNSLTFLFLATAQCE